MLNKICGVWLIGAAMIHFYDMGGADACNSKPTTPLVAKMMWPAVVIGVLLDYRPVKEHPICNLYIL